MSKKEYEDYVKLYLQIREYNGRVYVTQLRKDLIHFFQINRMDYSNFVKAFKIHDVKKLIAKLGYKHINVGCSSNGGAYEFNK